jgi:diacylglycerol kinase (ATP)
MKEEVQVQYPEDKQLHKLKRYLFVINPISGEVDKSALDKLLNDFATTYKWDYKTYKTTGNNDPEQLRQLLQEYQPEIAVAIGGDGTVSLVARLLVGTPIVLGIIPGGSGNGFSKDLGLPQNNFSAALVALLHGRIAKMDTLKANEFFFMHLADVGFNAHIVKLFNQSESRGLLTYMRFGLREFFKYPSNYYEVITDNGNFSGYAFMITVANSNKYGSSLTINPDGHWGDGRFEIIIIKQFKKKEALRIFYRLLTKKIKFSPHCHIIQCTRATVYCEKKKTLQYDGEFAKKVRKIDFEILPASLHIIVP